MLDVRPAAVAGTFYPRSEGELRSTLESLLDGAEPGPIPKAMIAPHAGYVYSGPVAATAYRRLEDSRASIRRVVVLGPSHFVSFEGLATPSSRAFETPLGAMPVDREVVEELEALPFVSCLDLAHEREHGLEVHLPFLQTLLERPVIVPLVVGRTRAEEVAEVLDRLWGGEETLIVISSDLSHFLDYERAQRRDHRTMESIEGGRWPEISPAEACGATAIRGLLCLAERRGLTMGCIDLRNSGDTAGPRNRVVGYGSFVDGEPVA